VKNKADEKEEDILKIREQHVKEQEALQYVIFVYRNTGHERHSRNSRKTQIEKMEAEVRKLQRRKNGSDDEDTIKKKPKKSYLNEELAKYSKVKGIHSKGKKRDEGDTLAVLNSFRGKLQDTMSVDTVDMSGVQENDEAVEESMEVDNDFGFLNHELHFPKDNGEETEKAERDYEVIDPRQRGAKAREEERERKKAALKAKGKDGRSRW